MAATTGTLLHTLVYGSFVGRDEFGNRYYQARFGGKSQRKRRWVIYNGIADASKVPANWHGWLHYTLDVPLPEKKKYNWQKQHLPNLTGTKGRYLPEGHISKGGARAASAADYEPWTPSNHA
jgi:NADH:ubiquinone oxidoreductase subunit